MGSLITQAEYARQRGVSRAAILKAVKTGRLTLVKGKVDVATADSQWTERTDQRQTRTKRTEDRPVEDPGPEQSDGSFFEAQRQREWERVKKDRLQRLALEGKLLDAERVRDAVSGMIITVRTKLLVIGDEMADKLASTSDPVRCRELVDGRISHALDELADYPANAA